jgi:uncharacterized protein YcbX
VSTLGAIRRYPVKSCRGEDVTTAVVERWGLAGDRRWMLVGDDGETVTAREHPRLLLVRPELVDGGLRLSAPDLDPIVVSIPAGASIDVTVFRRQPFAATLAEDAAHAWFGKLLGEPVRLVYGDDPTRRPTNRAFTEAGDCVSFADGYPLLLTNEASLAVLNDWIAAGASAVEGPLPMVRFRPNVVVAGAPAWAEDGWRRLRIGEARFRVVKGCDRCVITTTGPEDAARGKEPIATLARHRKWDGGTWFGVQLVPDNPGARISVGDEVAVLAAVDARDGPPR